MLGLLLILTYINDLLDSLVSNPKLFFDDTSLFLLICNKDLSAKNLYQDFHRINNLDFQQKMSINPEPSNQTQEFITSHLIKKSAHPPLVFDNSIVTHLITQKHLRMFLDTKLDF